MTVWAPFGIGGTFAGRAFALGLALALDFEARRLVLAAMTVYEGFAFEGLNTDFFGPIVALYSVVVYGPRRFARWEFAAPL